ncbi:MAG: hypothetical protein MMC33_003726 [Icmadophila ericetorum]|nr:hypothetical protein [Icmadophila ericetorum]
MSFFDDWMKQNESEEAMNKNNPTLFNTMFQDRENQPRQGNTQSDPAIGVTPETPKYVAIDHSYNELPTFTELSPSFNAPNVARTWNDNELPSKDEVLNQPMAQPPINQRGEYSDELFGHGLDPFLSRPSGLPRPASASNYSEVPESSNFSTPSRLPRSFTGSYTQDTMVNMDLNVFSTMTQHQGRGQSLPDLNPRPIEMSRHYEPSLSARPSTPPHPSLSSSLNVPQPTRRQGATSRGFDAEYQGEIQIQNRQRRQPSTRSGSMRTAAMSTSLPSSTSPGKRRVIGSIQDPLITSPGKRRRPSVPAEVTTQQPEADPLKSLFSILQERSKQLVKHFENYGEMERFEAYFLVRKILGDIDDAHRKMCTLKREAFCEAGEDCTALPGKCAICKKEPVVPSYLPRRTDLRRQGASKTIDLGAMEQQAMERSREQHTGGQTPPKRDQSGRSAQRREAGLVGSSHQRRAARSEQQFAEWAAKNPEREVKSPQRRIAPARRRSSLAQVVTIEQAGNGTEDDLSVVPNPNPVTPAEEERRRRQKATQNRYNATRLQNWEKQAIASEEQYDEYRVMERPEMPESHDAFLWPGFLAEQQVDSQAQATGQQTLMPSMETQTAAAEGAAEPASQNSSQVVELTAEHDSSFGVELSPMSELSLSDKVT